MQSIMVTAQKGLNSCAATQVLSLEGTLAMTVPPTPRPVQPTPPTRPPIPRDSQPQYGTMEIDIKF